MVCRRLLMTLLMLNVICARVDAADAADAADLSVDVHGFVSFGLFRTWDNAYLTADSEDGSSELWEAALSVTSRPMDRLRLGVQLFARDLGIYDNGKPGLDYAYADWRAADWLGVQAGRVRVPAGFSQEEIDNDTARTQIFLPWSVYPLRVRDFFLAVDGAKAYGYLPLGGEQSIEYTAFGGISTVGSEGGFATSLSRIGYGTITELKAGPTVGGMLHWNGPSGVALRSSLWHSRDLEIQGQRGNTLTEATTDRYWWAVASASWDLRSVILAAEYARTHIDGTAQFSPFAPQVRTLQNLDGGYVSATWLVNRWFELYGAFETARSSITAEELLDTRAWVGAVAVRPTRNWSLKLEWREIHGPLGRPSTIENPSGVDEHWRMVAIKTTADF